MQTTPAKARASQSTAAPSKTTAAELKAQISKLRAQLVRGGDLIASVGNVNRAADAAFWTAQGNPEGADVLSSLDKVVAQAMAAKAAVAQQQGLRKQIASLETQLKALSAPATK